jgi:hypothetical protein
VTSADHTHQTANIFNLFRLFDMRTVERQVENLVKAILDAVELNAAFAYLVILDDNAGKWLLRGSALHKTLIVFGSRNQNFGLLIDFH